MNLPRVVMIAKTSLVLLAILVMGPGCGSTGHKSGKPVAWNVSLTKNTEASIEVDLVGISQTEDAYWRRTVKPTKYWTPGDPARKQVQARARSTRFESGKVYQLKFDDAVWSQWRTYGATELLIMADLPGRYSDDEADPRRLILSLGKNEWRAKDKTIEIEILDGQIRVLTPQNQ